MATIKILIRKKKKKANGEYPLYLRLIKNRRSQFISLGYSVLLKDWDERSEQVKTGHPNKIQLNNFLTAKKSEALKLALSLEAESKTVKTSDIKKQVVGGISKSFTKYWQTKIDLMLHAEKIATYKRNKSILHKLNLYLEGADLTFEEINVAFLNDYENHLQSIGNKVNTIHNNLKTIRAVLYDAIAEGLFAQGNNPFFSFRLKKEKGTKERLTKEDIFKILDLQISEKESTFHVRNYFMFSLYCAGIRFGDLCQLTWDNINDNQLKYNMNKTGTGQSIPLVKQAQKILKYYQDNFKNDLNLIFPILREKDLTTKFKLFNAISSNNTLVNRHLKTIGGLAKISFPISFHISRHSYSELARKSGMDLFALSKSLRHSSLNVTEGYLNSFDDAIVEKELNKVFKGMK
jgi:integrase/recombinase XerD